MNELLVFLGIYFLLEILLMFPFIKKYMRERYELIEKSEDSE